MDEMGDWTCGKGLAANAVLPERLGAVAAAMAEVLRGHMDALNPADDAARPELDAYRSVSGKLAEAGSILDAAAREMTAYRDLPMAEHDMAAMTRPIVGETFAAFVERKRDLLAVLRDTEEEDRQMLDQMQG